MTACENALDLLVYDQSFNGLPILKNEVHSQNHAVLHN